MWIFTKTSFLSVVEYDPAKDMHSEAFKRIAKKRGTHLLIRARVRADLDTLKSVVPNLVVEDDTQADYRFRAIVPRAKYSKWLVAQAEDIDYDSHFKEVVQRNATQGNARHAAMMNVWSNMYALQPYAPSKYTTTKKGGKGKGAPRETYQSYLAQNGQTVIDYREKTTRANYAPGTPGTNMIGAGSGKKKQPFDPRLRESATGESAVDVDSWWDEFVQSQPEATQTLLNQDGVKAAALDEKMSDLVGEDVSREATIDLRETVDRLIKAETAYGVAEYEFPNMSDSAFELVVRLQEDYARDVLLSEDIIRLYVEDLRDEGMVEEIELAVLDGEDPEEAGERVHAALKEATSELREKVADAQRKDEEANESPAK